MSTVIKTGLYMPYMVPFILQSRFQLCQIVDMLHWNETQLCLTRKPDSPVREKEQVCGRIGQLGIDLLQPVACRAHPTHSDGTEHFLPRSQLLRRLWPTETLRELHHPGVAVAIEWTDVFVWETDRASLCDPSSVFACLEAAGAHTPAEEQITGTTDAAFSYTPFSESTENSEVRSLVLYFVLFFFNIIIVHRPIRWLPTVQSGRPQMVAS